MRCTIPLSHCWIQFSILIPFVAAQCKIIFDRDLIPDVKEPLPLWTLEAPVTFSPEQLGPLLKKAAPKAVLNKTEAGYVAFDGDRLAAYIDLKNGETQIFPALNSLQPSQNDLKVVALRAATTYLSYEKQKLFPKDGTDVKLDDPAVLLASQQNKSQHRDLPVARPYLATVNILRSIAGYEVTGTGSKGSFSVGAGGTILGLSHRWRPAAPCGQKAIAYPRKKTYDRIVDQIRSQVSGQQVVQVTTVDVVYYDGEMKYIQPVYRYNAMVNSNSTGTETAIEGFVPLGDFIENLPVIDKPDELPKEPEQTPKVEARNLPHYFAFDVGRYVVREDAAAWVTQANKFYNHLLLEGAKSTLYLPINKQYYWSEPYMYLSAASSYIDSVHIAITFAHGDNWLFSTLKNCCDLVSIQDIRNLGARYLRYWAIHACNVIPAPIDRLDAFDPWWGVFGGLHTVVGFRTHNFIADNTPEWFARSMGWGGSVAWSWMTATNVGGSYGPKKTYYDKGYKKTVRYGRPAVVTVCGHSDDNLNKSAKLADPTCLRMWWYG